MLKPLNYYNYLFTSVFTKYCNLVSQFKSNNSVNSQQDARLIIYIYILQWLSTYKKDKK
ncbi:hypothetical protein SAMN05216524_106554 [Mucilaginibacter sp. OK098]|nr:hypothetical protein SAMN05216524_106554 [Mucilaginibacter sp. OK098]